MKNLKRKKTRRKFETKYVILLVNITLHDTIMTFRLSDLQEEQFSILRNKPNGALLTLEDLNNMSYASKVGGIKKKKNTGLQWMKFGQMISFLKLHALVCSQTYTYFYGYQVYFYVSRLSKRH